MMEASLNELASLPSKNEIIAGILGSLKSPGFRNCWGYKCCNQRFG